MTAGDIDRRADVATPAHIISSAVGTAEALAIGVVRLAERTLVEAVHAAEDVGARLVQGPGVQLQRPGLWFAALARPLLRRLRGHDRGSTW